MNILANKKFKVLVMTKSVNCFIPYQDKAQVEQTVNGLRESNLVNKIFLLTTDTAAQPVEGCEVVHIESLKCTPAMKKIAERSDSLYTLIYTKESTLVMGMFAIERMIKIASDTAAGMVYSDHFQIIEGVKKQNPVITYQQGSLRDDFNFGSVLFYDSIALKDAVAGMDVKYCFAALYDLRLKVSQKREIVHINEYLYTEVEQDTRKSGEKIFDYVDPKNRAVQIEMEAACTEHLKNIGGYLKPVFKTIEFNQGEFPVEASVIIPVFNRIKTVEDAIKSVLIQKTKFPFNLIIVDNHSTDGTYEAIEKFAGDPRLIHVVPDRYDLGIGGCWNLGVHHPKCGKFAIQLDSDDVYSGEDTVQKIVDAFYQQNCAMVVGTYMMTNFNMEMIAPGIIDHKEWTPDNGRNNALRINGLGAPRAFYTPVLRNIKVPNTSYGEDYALGLNISREYQIGRIYDVLYHCRRWEDNSDASLDIVKMNGHNTYKDRIRTWELKARIALNKQKAK